MMEQLTISQTAFGLPAAVRNRKIEIDNLKTDIAALEKEISETKPIVQEYNEKLRARKNLRRELSKRENLFRGIMEFLDGFLPEIPIVDNETETKEEITEMEESGNA